MRIAVLADIHGNLPAFEAALAHVHTLAPDLLVFCGDIVNGSPDSRACWDLAVSRNAPILRGNHERYVQQYGKPGLPPEWYTDRFAPVRWTAAQFRDDEREQMGALPHWLRLPDFPDLLFCHASARSDYDTIIAYTPEDTLEPMFPDSPERWIIRAHNHVPQVRLWGDRMIITTGSVGLPLDHRTVAQYLLLTRRGSGWQIAHQSVPYDLDAARQRFLATGYLDAAGAAARLCLREVLTASFYWVPFLRAYTRWSPDGTLSLDEAVQRFLNDDLSI